MVALIAGPAISAAGIADVEGASGHGLWMPLSLIVVLVLLTVPAARRRADRNERG